MIWLLACDWGWWLGEPPGIPVDEPDSGVEPTLQCLPQIELAEEHVLEGDIVELVASCATGAEATFSVEGASGSWEGETWAWTPGLDEAGTRELVLWAELEAGSEQTRTTVHVVDAIEDPDNVTVDPLTYLFEWGVPVVHIDPDGELYRDYHGATVWYRGAELRGEAKIRGATSSNYPKPGYALRFDDEQDFSADGLGDKDHLNLATPFDDNSYVRQKLVYDTWLELGDDRLGVESFFAVVYVEGAYKGLFTAMERVDDELADEAGYDRDGNLYKGVDWDANFFPWGYDGEPKETLHDGYEKKEGEPAEGEEGAFDDLDAFVGWVLSALSDELVEDAESWMELEEFVDWYVLTRAVAGDDSIGKNMYLYRDPELCCFKYVPWDFNHSYGQNWYTGRVAAETWDDYGEDNGLFRKLASTGLFEERMAEVVEGPFSAEAQLAKVDAYYAVMERSAQRDWAVWAEAYRTYEGWVDKRDDDWTSFEEEQEYLREWIEGRVEVLKTGSDR